MWTTVRYWVPKSLQRTVYKITRKHWADYKSRPERVTDAKIEIVQIYGLAELCDALCNVLKRVGSYFSYQCKLL